MRAENGLKPGREVENRFSSSLGMSTRYMGEARTTKRLGAVGQITINSDENLH